MQVKRLLDDALLNAGVQFLYGCYATELLREEGGRPAGIVIANRSGRQARRRDHQVHRRAAHRLERPYIQRPVARARFTRHMFDVLSHDVVIRQVDRRRKHG